MKKVCGGLLKNAIENTPDEGRIEVRVKSENDGTRIEVHDYGIGIHPLDQKAIFSGFFHTQETTRYATRKPYEFDAGGSGVDLLRMKVFSGKHHFSIGFESEGLQMNRGASIERNSAVQGGMGPGIF